MTEYWIVLKLLEFFLVLGNILKVFSSQNLGKNTVLGDFINTMKTTFYLSLKLLKGFFQITNLQVTKEKPL